jgi:hypothetical protein
LFVILNEWLTKILAHFIFMAIPRDAAAAAPPEAELRSGLDGLTQATVVNLERASDWRILAEATAFGGP